MPPCFLFESSSGLVLNPRDTDPVTAVHEDLLILSVSVTGGCRGLWRQQPRSPGLWSVSFCCRERRGLLFLLYGARRTSLKMGVPPPWLAEPRPDQGGTRTPPTVRTI